MLGGLTFTALSPPAVLVDEMTLSAGVQATSINGSSVNLGIGDDLLVGSTTTQMPTVASNSTLGGLILQGGSPRRVERPPLIRHMGIWILEALFVETWIL